MILELKFFCPLPASPPSFFLTNKITKEQLKVKEKTLDFFSSAKVKESDSLLMALLHQETFFFLTACLNAITNVLCSVKNSLFVFTLETRPDKEFPLISLMLLNRHYLSLVCVLQLV